MPWNKVKKVNSVYVIFVQSNWLSKYNHKWLWENEESVDLNKISYQGKNTEHIPLQVYNTEQIPPKYPHQI